MNHRARLKLLLRSPLFYFGAFMLVTCIAICSIFDEKNNDAQLAAAIFGQGGIIVCLWAYWRTRFIITDPASQAILKRRSRMAVVMGVGMFCMCLMLTPVILWSDMAKMQGFLFWYIAATGLLGLLGLVGLFIWLKRSSD